MFNNNNRATGIDDDDDDDDESIARVMQVWSLVTKSYYYCLLQTWGQFNSGIAIAYLKKVQLELINFELELKFPAKKLIHKLIYHLIF